MDLMFGLGWAFVGLALILVAFLVSVAIADADLVTLAAARSAKLDGYRGKVVWITGASQGLGEVLALLFANLGAKIILSSRSADKLHAVAAKCGSKGEDVLVLPFDLCGSFAELEAAATAADAAFGGAGVDYLVHNAGASQHALAVDITAEVTDQMFALNALGPIKLTRAALPLMLKRNKGRFVVVASMSSKVPSPGQAVYAACKQALFGYFSSLATEVAATRVGVTICCPGPMATGSDATPRVIFGATGRIVHNNTGVSSSRMDPGKAALYIAAAALEGLDECWIARHPVLAIGYIVQMVPRLGWYIMKRIGPKRAKAVNEGRSGYDVGAILKTSPGQAAASAAAPPTDTAAKKRS